MRYHSIKQIARLCLLGAALACPSISQADPYTIASGWDLFTTATPPTKFDNIPFQGVSLGTFDFGGSIGVQNVGNTDTIMYRPTKIVGSSGGTVPFTAQLVGLQLESVGPVSIGGGPVGEYFLTLQSFRGGAASTDSGLMYFNPDNAGGTFTDTLDVYYDLRYGNLIGPIVASGECVLPLVPPEGTSGDPWTHNGSYPPVIQNVNYLLDGTDTTKDFWPGPPPDPDYDVHSDGSANTHAVLVIPEPSGLALLSLGGLALLRRRRGKTD
ncbi:MAG: PEP-CTERM sorting domain-containing protein [Sedimentisphaerales bacterium]